MYQLCSSNACNPLSPVENEYEDKVNRFRQKSLNFRQTTRLHISEMAYICVGTLNNTYTTEYKFLSPLALVVTQNQGKEINILRKILYKVGFIYKIKVLLANVDILWHRAE
jgi:hypothetical protein